METLAIGERKVFTDVTLEVIYTCNPDCSGCWFFDRPHKCYDHPYKYIMGGCAWFHREDDKNVIFKAVKETT